MIFPGPAVHEAGAVDRYARREDSAGRATAPARGRARAGQSGTCQRPSSVKPSPSPAPALSAYGLYLRIDLERLQCLNESREGSGRGVFKPWEERTDRSKFVESDADEELLFNIPFTGNVKLKGIIIMGEDDDSHPSEMRLYKNIPQMSFDDTDREPDQTFSLNRDLTGELEYATKISRFSNVYHLSIHISKNFGADTTKVLYIGLRGEWTELRRHEVTICNYEASANPADHRVHQVTPQTHFIS
nr:PITH domain-containing protein 1 [Vulpes vulpes]